MTGPKYDGPGRKNACRGLSHVQTKPCVLCGKRNTANRRGFCNHCLDFYKPAPRK